MRGARLSFASVVLAWQLLAWAGCSSNTVPVPTTPTVAATPAPSFQSVLANGPGQITFLSATPGAGSTVSGGALSLAFSVTSNAKLDDVWFSVSLSGQAGRCLQNRDYGIRPFNFAPGQAQTIVVSGFRPATGSTCNPSFSVTGVYAAVVVLQRDNTVATLFGHQYSVSYNIVP